MTEFSVDFELEERREAEAEFELEPRSEIEPTFELNVAIEGPQGPEGPRGPQGEPGQNATINGYTTVVIEGTDGLSLRQEGSTLYISGKTLQDTKQDKLNTAQMNAVNSGITTQKVTSYDNHISNTTIHVTQQDKTTWNGKQNALNSTQLAAVNSGITSGGVSQITTNKNNIASEVTNRQNADNDLQSQIDAITASSDVTDIVGTYAELQAYDTSSLPPNSIIKVLQDESKNNETTYYRWVITQGTGSWVLIGEEGPYYTKSQADERFATAAQGAKADSAVQSVTTGNTNGTLRVDGTDVPVKGLGSAAYTSSSDYWTVGAYGDYYQLQETYSPKRIEYMPNEDGQDYGLAVMSANPTFEYVPYAGTWNGRMLVGNVDRSFLLGTATSNGSTTADMCCIGAHTWSPLGWDDIYLNTDGNKTVYIGGNNWTKNSGWFKVENSGNNTGGKVQVNTGTITDPVWKDVGTVKSVNNASPDPNGNVTITIPDPLPSQTGQSGKYLTTNGTNASWGSVNAGIFYWGE